MSRVGGRAVLASVGGVAVPMRHDKNGNFQVFPVAPLWLEKVARSLSGCAESKLDWCRCDMMKGIRRILGQSARLEGQRARPKRNTHVIVCFLLRSVHRGAAKAVRRDSHLSKPSNEEGEREREREVLT